MHLDDETDVGNEWLFGSTVAWTEDTGSSNDLGGSVFIWKVQLDANHDPDPSKLSYLKLHNENNK